MTRTSRNVSYSQTSRLLTRVTQIVRQVTSCRGISNAGSHPLIRGKITTSPADRATAEPGSGSFKGTRSRNGRHQERALFYGSMANVSRQPCSYSFIEADDLLLLAGSGKSVLWCVNLRIVSFRELTISYQFHDYRDDRDDVQIWARIACYLLL
jgi:hypothetical protein